MHWQAVGIHPKEIWYEQCKLIRSIVPEPVKSYQERFQYCASLVGQRGNTLESGNIKPIGGLSIIHTTRKALF